MATERAGEAAFQPLLPTAVSRWPEPPGSRIGGQALETQQPLGHCPNTGVLGTSERPGRAVVDS